MPTSAGSEKVAPATSGLEALLASSGGGSTSAGARASCFADRVRALLAEEGAALTAHDLDAAVCAIAEFRDARRLAESVDL